MVSALTNIDQANALLPGDEVQRQLHVLHALRVDAWLLTVAPDFLLRQHLDENDEPHTVAEVRGQVLDSHALHLQVLVAPSREGLLLDALPFRVHVLVAIGGHVPGVPEMRENVVHHCEGASMSILPVNKF